jgi:hypothetical protein
MQQTLKPAYRLVCDEALNPRTWVELAMIVVAMLATVTALAAMGGCQ